MDRFGAVPRKTTLFWHFLHNFLGTILDTYKGNRMMSAHVPEPVFHEKAISGPGFAVTRSERSNNCIFGKKTIFSWQTHVYKYSKSAVQVSAGTYDPSHRVGHVCSNILIGEIPRASEGNIQ